MDITETYYKCFLMDAEGGSVMGLLTENEKGVIYDILRDAGNGKFRSSGPNNVTKSYWQSFNLVPTLDYWEAYNFLVNFKNKDEPIPVKI